jgi:cytoskeletal protein CcmA (bactofilin family)
MATPEALREQGRTNSSNTPAQSPEERRVTAWIGQGVSIEGKISSAQDLRIDGKVQGTIEVGNHGLIIGASAVIRANLVARSILVCGAVTGNVTATERLDVQATGSIEGDLKAPRLAMADGAIVRGKVETAGTRGAQSRPVEGAAAAAPPSAAESPVTPGP